MAFLDDLYIVLLDPARAREAIDLVTGCVEAHTGIAANRGLSWALTCGAATSRWRSMGSSPWAAPSARLSGARTALKWRKPFCNNWPQMPELHGSSCAAVLHPVPTMCSARRSPQHSAGHIPRRMMWLYAALCKYVWASLPMTLPALRETLPSFPSPSFPPKSWPRKRFALPLRLTGQLGLMRSRSSPHATLPLPHGQCEPCPLSTPLIVAGGGQQQLTACGRRLERAPPPPPQRGHTARRMTQHQAW